MARLDGYLRSIEKLGASAAVLTSNQTVTLRFPAGDRQATQVTPHDQLVGIIREIAPPPALDQLDQNRPASFEYESGGARYHVDVVTRPGAWTVSIEPAPAVAPAPVAATPAPASEMMLERTQYDAPAAARPTTSGSGVLDDLTRAARAAGASDVILAAAQVPLQRVSGQLAAMAASAIDGDQLARELGVVAPAEARGAWSERGAAVFAYGDGVGRIRVTLGRDLRGPTAALRLLPSEPPRLELGVDAWLDGRGGLVLVAGPSGSGKTLALAALVRDLAERRRRVVAIEDPIEIAQPSPWVSQREVGLHVGSVHAAVSSAMLEAADAIAVGAPSSPEAALAILQAATAGHLVITTIVAPPGAALEGLLGLVPTERRDRLEKSAGLVLLGVIAAGSGRGYEIVRSDRG
jgi:Tfp pilus assembly pilus retraction ATPase PilT